MNGRDVISRLRSPRILETLRCSGQIPLLPSFIDIAECVVWNELLCRVLLCEHVVCVGDEENVLHTTRIYK